MNNNIRASKGFTLMELLFSTALFGMVMGIILSSVLALNTSYFTDILRTRINGNLRSAMDILSMNIRQTGENLPQAFPAVVLTDGPTQTPDTVILRRSLLTEVLTLCQDRNIGDSTLYVSSSSLANADCVPSNVSAQFTAFENARSSYGGTLRVYIYDSENKAGEFLDYTSGAYSGGDYLLTVSPLTRNYSQLKASIYVVEEFQFSLNTTDKKMMLSINGDSTTTYPVAFDITDFQTSLEMDDFSTLTSFDSSSTKTWKKIREINISLTGTGSYKGHSTSYTISAKFFPRNVLSYEQYQ